ncbi:unnamed protein product [Protopolystoma xenopodis]|uniref:Uncharacterized protein n=1 Tax=Protopolystoma xenopodis TaxID=117903 RepID=A0A3S5ALV1_9PLAT|nr:unnamed protein product [Protopolystoma xenopodis]
MYLSFFISTSSTFPISFAPSTSPQRLLCRIPPSFCPSPRLGVAHLVVGPAKGDGVDKLCPCVCVCGPREVSDTRPAASEHKFWPALEWTLTTHPSKVDLREVDLQICPPPPPPSPPLALTLITCRRTQLHKQQPIPQPGLRSWYRRGLTLICQFCCAATSVWSLFSSVSNCAFGSGCDVAQLAPDANQTPTGMPAHLPGILQIRGSTLEDSILSPPLLSSSSLPPLPTPPVITLPSFTLSFLLSFSLSLSLLSSFGCQICHFNCGCGTGENAGSSVGLLCLMFASTTGLVTVVTRDGR